MEKIIIEGYANNLLLEITKELNKLDNSEKIKITIDSVRTLSQNQLFHGLVRVICDETGENDIERMKRIIKKSLGYYSDIIEDGEKYRIFQSTADMSKVEFNEFLLKLSVWAYENCNINLPIEKQTKKINIKLTNND